MQTETKARLREVMILHSEFEGAFLLELKKCYETATSMNHNDKNRGEISIQLAQAEVWDELLKLATPGKVSKKLA